MDFLPESINKYAENHTMEEPSILKMINRETHLKTQLPQMLAGNLQGQFLRMLSLMLQPNRILEIGTYTGYSAICLAQGLQQGGILHTIEIDAELEEMISGFVKKSGMVKKIKLHIGDAIDVISTIKEKLDMVYIDADKTNYCKYFDKVFPMLNKGGFIIADNVLWSGRVLDKKKDKDTKGIVAFNNKIHKDKRIENILVPLRDGLMICRKK